MLQVKVRDIFSWDVVIIPFPRQRIVDGLHWFESCHTDGNPWLLDDLRIDNPDTQKPYDWDKYSKKVCDSANALIEKLLKQTGGV